MHKETVVKFIDAVFGEASYLAPELVICLGAFLLLILELIKPVKHPDLKIGISLGTIALSIGSCFVFAIDGTYFEAYLYQNDLIRMIKLLLLGVAFTVLHFPKHQFSSRSEYSFLILIVLLGSMILIQAHNILVFYLALEMISISSYVLITFGFDQKGFEGGIKYLLFGALASGIMLYGISLVYGLSGTLQLSELMIFTPTFANAEYWYVLGTMLFLVGFFFKLSLVPFHIWTPDVYEAAPTSVVAYISVAPKVAVFVFLLKFFGIALQDDLWKWVLSTVALASIFFGNLSAIRQQNAQRMMAYSTIAHAGTMLIAIVAGNELGMQSLIFYLVVYAGMNMVGFYLIRIFNDHGIQSISELSGVKGSGLLLGSVVVVMIALTGLPPTGGFMAKLLVFTSIWESYGATGDTFMLWLFILGLINAVISLFYYLKIPYYLIVRNDDQTSNIHLSGQNKAFLIIGTIFILWTFFKADMLQNLINDHFVNF